MRLKNYRQKREFSQTPEPRGKIVYSKKKRIFVVQKHASKHLHYDFRLEIDGVLKSWAVPKGPCLDPTVKRLAVQVEDHPLEYGKFEGIIPKGQYGAGAVMLWDTGTWHPIDNTKHKDNVFYFELKGKKLKGLWKLIQIKGDPKNWLLIKHQDKEAIAQEQYNIVEKQCLSVKTSKTMDEITSGIRAVKPKKNTTKPLMGSLLKNLKKSVLPSQIKPQLATLTNEVPAKDDWLHEVKLDGYRLLTYIKDNKVDIITRNGLHWTSHFKNIVNELKNLKLKNTILDGELVVLDHKGKPNFQLLQNALKTNQQDAMVYYIFDLLYYQGYKLMDLPLIKRKQCLEQLLPSDNPVLRYHQHIIGQGSDIFENACALGLEGIISKKCDASYLQKRTHSWLKVKCHNRQEFVVGGYTKSKNPLAYFGALLLGYYKNGDFVYCGRVGTGFNEASFKECFATLQKIKTDHCPFKNKPPMKDVASWVKPQMIVEVEFSEFTSDGIVRHASFKGSRQDKKPQSIAHEKVYSPKEMPDTALDSQLQITHPDRIVYPKIKATKLQIAQYYYSIQEWILPYISNRSLAVVRCPKQITDSCFFQKHVPSSKATEHIFQGDKYIYIKNINGLLELTQMNVIEIHAYANRVDNLNKADCITFDLDPGEGVSWKKVVDSAFLIKEELEKQNLTSFVKTTGGKGLHIVIPIIRRYDWEYIGLFSKTFSEYMAAKYPKDYVSEMSKAKRKRKIYIDYLRNKPGASAIAPYSLRAREWASVATPLSWDELNDQLKPSDFTINTIADRLEKLSTDPWEGFFDLKQKLPKGDG